MHLVSTINPLTKSLEDVPALLFCLNEHRMFLARKNTYQSMLTAVQEKFSLEHAPTFVISSLDICQGADVVIDEHAYDMMAPYLDEVKLVFQAFQEPAGFITKTKKEDVDALMNDTHATHAVNAEMNDDTMDTGEKEGDYHAPASPAAAVEEREPDTLFSATTEEEEHEAAMQEMLTFHMSNVIAPRQEGENMEHPVASHSHQELLLQVKDEKRTVPVKKEFAPPGPANPSTKVLVEPNTNNYKARDRPVSKASVHASQAPPPSQLDGEDPDSRYKVYISGPLPGQNAEFKTRGGHAVKKVLAGACKTFGLEYERAQLLLLVTLEDEDGTEAQHRFLCAKHETMAGCGVEPNATLVVVMDEEAEAEDEDEDS